MKDLAGTIDLALWLVLILATVFIFAGEPDLWDKWHAHALEQGCPAPSGPE